LTAPELLQLFPLGVASAFIFGLAMGSFLNVCIYRLPQGLSVVHPRSACPGCGARIRAYDNIPVLSWVLLRGRCRDFKAPISARYALVELSTALLFVFCFVRFGFTLETIKYSTLSFLLLGLIFTDVDCRLLPDALTLPGLALGFLFSLLVTTEPFISLLLPYRVWRVFPPALAWRAASLIDSLSGALLGSLLIYGAGFLYFRLKGIEGMGFGDVKLMAMVGAYLGMPLTVFTIGSSALLASIFGLTTMLVVWRKRLRRRQSRARESAEEARRRAWRSAYLVYRNYEIPFGSFLGTMAIVALFYGHALMDLYLRLWMRPR
jgi:leader peptidase (prepilin peptidase)/N-methyltransferase